LDWALIRAGHVDKKMGLSDAGKGDIRLFCIIFEKAEGGIPKPKNWQKTTRWGNDCV